MWPVAEPPPGRLDGIEVHISHIACGLRNTPELLGQFLAGGYTGSHPVVVLSALVA